MSAIDQAFMARALRLAARGRCTTDPNPRVGCVLVRDGEVVGEGFHHRAGEPHAEPLALAAAGERAHGATAYVSLEPCCHHGRTPPCTDALITAGVARVVGAMADPNPRVAGSGYARLRAAGIQVATGVLEDAARALNPGFAKRMERGLPYLRCKLAMSLDGRTAMASGESRWITSGAARRDVQRLRAASSAILTGVGTVLADDPSLNVRLDAAELGYGRMRDWVRQPLRVVLDSRLRMSPDARMLGLPGATLIIADDDAPARRRALEAAGAEVAIVPSCNGGLDLDAVLRLLAEREVNEVLLETGPTLAGSMLRAGLVDELIVYCAPHLMGGDARALLDLPGIERMEQRIALRWSDVRQVGPDLRLTLKPTSS